MGLIRVFLLVLAMTIFCLLLSAQTAWNGPQAIINLGWGNGVGQVAIEYGDTEDSFPHVFGVDEQGRILLSDGGNARLQIFTPDGSLFKIVSPIGWPADISGWPLNLTLLSNSRVLIKRGDRYQIYNHDGSLSSEFNGVAAHILEIAALPDDSIVVYKSDEKRFYLYSPTGQLIKTSATRPLELGVVKSARENPDGSGRTVIEFNDNIYNIQSPRLLESFKRDTRGWLYGAIIAGVPGKQYYRVYKYDRCSKVVGSVDLPVNNITIEQTMPRQPTPIVTVLEEYGEPVVAPNGDVYTWKRTPETYSILKWTWVDDPDTPPCPETPRKGRAKAN